MNLNNKGGCIFNKDENGNYVETLLKVYPKDFENIQAITGAPMFYNTYAKFYTDGRIQIEIAFYDTEERDIPCRLYKGFVADEDMISKLNKGFQNLIDFDWGKYTYTKEQMFEWCDEYMKR